MDLSKGVVHACWLVGILLLSACGSNGSSPSADGDCNTEGLENVTCSSQITQWGITWTFEFPVPIGQYANGDYWAVGPVTITSISPQMEYERHDAPSTVDVCNDQWNGESDCSAYCSNTIGDSSGHCAGEEEGFGTCVCERIHHGFEINPTPAHQAFDDRSGSVDGTVVPSLPYAAQPGDSVVKAISVEPLDDRECRSCLQTAAVLTITESIPEQGGTVFFRPPYVGSERIEYRTTDLRTHLLPSLASVADTPSLSDAHSWFQRVQLDHMPGRTSTYLRPADNLPFYAADIARQSSDGALRLMLDDSIEEKMDLLIAYVQKGMDYYHFYQNGQTWSPGGGEQPGNKLPIVFFASMLGDETVQANVRGIQLYDDHHAFFNEDGTVLWGNNGWYNELDEYRYWAIMTTGSGSKTRMDPYYLIDGGVEPGGAYQFCCTSQPFKGSVLALHLMASLKAVWEPEALIDYVDRWVNLGTWTQTDICAPADGICAGGDHVGADCTQANGHMVCSGEDAYCDLSVYWDPDGTLGLENHYGVTYGPDPNNPGQCIGDTDPDDGIGRFPHLHGKNADDGGRRSAFQGNMWDAYRGSSCYDGICEDGEVCPYDCN